MADNIKLFGREVPAWTPIAIGGVAILAIIGMSNKGGGGSGGGGGPQPADATGVLAEEFNQRLQEDREATQAALNETGTRYQELLENERNNTLELISASDARLRADYESQLAAIGAAMQQGAISVQDALAQQEAAYMRLFGQQDAATQSQFELLRRWVETFFNQSGGGSGGGGGGGSGSGGGGGGGGGGGSISQTSIADWAAGIGLPLWVGEMFVNQFGYLPPNIAALEQWRDSQGWGVNWNNYVDPRGGG